MALLLAACVRTTVREFVPSPDNPRYTPERGSAAVRQYLGLRCGALPTGGRDSATINARVQLDSAGLATLAVMRDSSGDEVMDGVIGTVLAQLDLSQWPGREKQRREYRAAVAYSCRDSVAARITLAP